MEEVKKNDELNLGDLKKILGGVEFDAAVEQLSPEAKKIFRSKQIEELEKARQILTSGQQVSKEENTPRTI